MRLAYLFLIFVLILPISFAIETLDLNFVGVKLEVIEKQAFNLNVVESTSLRIGNPRNESIVAHKMSVLKVKETSIILKLKKFDNITISLGQERKIDFDNDDIFDVSIFLLEIRPNRGTLIFKSLDALVKPMPIIPTHETLESSNQSANKIIIINNNNTKTENNSQESKNIAEVKNITEADLTQINAKTKADEYAQEEVNPVLLIVLPLLFVIVLIIYLIHRFR